MDYSGLCDLLNWWVEIVSRKKGNWGFILAGYWMHAEFFVA